MKSYIKGLITGTLSCAILMSSIVYGESVVKKITAFSNPNISIVIDGKQTELKQTPISYNGTTYLPLRELGSLFNKEVIWDGSKQTVQLTTKKKESAANKETLFYSYLDFKNSMIQKHSEEEFEKAAKDYLKYASEHTIPDVMVFYDSGNKMYYWSEELILLFFPLDILDGLQKYTIDLDKRVLTIKN